MLPRATTRDEWLTYLGCAVLVAVLGAWVAFDASESQTTATGVVTAGGQWVDCHVEFRDRDGVRHEFTQNQAGSKGPGILSACTMEVGQQATVYYDLADPENAGLAAPEKERAFGVVFVALGIGAGSYVLFRLRALGATSQTRKSRQRR
ncbi:DUF3592 domain-containing protein [Nocardioides sp. NBC_00368]|uniref:DUF3592 domain-containing protein n=1 Tax=Nocardioides sp. NBC_00368 TaxID=2976000 RepID=UPI002E1DF51D